MVDSVVDFYIFLQFGLAVFILLHKIQLNALPIILLIFMQVNRMLSH